MTRNAKAIQSKSRSHQITQVSPDRFTVTSGSSGQTYQVTITPTGATCTCEWAKFRPRADRRSGCSHVVATMNFIAEQEGRRVMAWASSEDARRQHRPVTQIGDGVTLTSRLAD